MLCFESFNADIISSFTFIRPPTSSQFTVCIVGAPIDFVNIRFILSKNDTQIKQYKYTYIKFIYNKTKNSLLNFSHFDLSDNSEHVFNLTNKYIKFMKHIFKLVFTNLLKS